MTIDEFLDKLEGVRPNGNGFQAVCPHHEDREASLGVTEGDDGRILLQCYAGCATPDIVETMGLRMADLFPNTRRRDELPEAVYDYTDEVGNLLFQAVRFPGKRFKQRHHDPDHPDADADGWVWNLEGVRRVPYRLPELLQAIAEQKTIYVVEGEKDANRITAETGRFATCNPMGAGKWRPEYSVFFAGAKQVIILQDRDEPGRRHAQRVKADLESVGVPVLVFQAKQGKDISDHFDAGFPMEDVVRPRAQPKRGIITAREMVEAGLEYLTYRPTDLPGYPLIPGVQAAIARPGRLYTWGAYTGDGKTTAALQGTRNVCEMEKHVIYWTLEMSEADIRNRLIAHKGVPLWMLESPWELRAHPRELALYKLALEEMAEWKLDIVYDTNPQIERIVEDSIDREADFVVIDHVHRLAFGDRRQLEEKIKMLTNLALDANVPVLALAQLRKFSRGKDMVAFPPPTSQDFRETSTLGDESSIAVALWRQRDQEGLRYVGDASQFRVLKNRHRTSRLDQAGHIELLNFDTTTQLYSTGGIYSEQRQQEPAQQPAEPEVDVWGDDLSNG